MKQIQALNDLEIGISFLKAMETSDFCTKGVVDYLDKWVYPYLSKTRAELSIKQKPRRP